MVRSLLLCSLAASASALVAPVPAAKSAVAMNYQASEALPFMEKPEALDGTYAGDVGFDPFGFTSIFDVKWLREAESKHGAMQQLFLWLSFTEVILSAGVAQMMWMGSPR